MRPTILALTGLKDSYVSDGRVVTEILQGDVLPKSLHQHHGTVEKLGRLYKQLNASFGQFAADTLTASTRALASNAAGDTTYTNIENEIAGLTTQRDALAGNIKIALHNAEFNDQKINKKDAKAWLKEGKSLLEQASDLAAGP